MHLHTQQTVAWSTRAGGVRSHLSLVRNAIANLQSIFRRAHRDDHGIQVEGFERADQAALKFHLSLVQFLLQLLIKFLIGFVSDQALHDSLSRAALLIELFANNYPQKIPDDG